MTDAAGGSLERDIATCRRQSVRRMLPCTF
jgi:hypothetical protein